MADIMQQQPITFGTTEFVDNPEPRCPCLLLLDTSGSMQGQPLAELNSGLVVFKDELMADALAAKRVEVGIVTFGPPKVELDFQTAEQFVPPNLHTTGDTPMGAAILLGLEMLRKRKDTLKSNGIAYYRPWIFLITDGAPTDPWKEAAHRVASGEAEKAFQFFAVGVEGANMEILAQISTRTPLSLKELKFRELFTWLSASMQKVSHSQVGDKVTLENPASPTGWATAG